MPSVRQARSSARFTQPIPRTIPAVQAPQLPSGGNQAPYGRPNPIQPQPNVFPPQNGGAPFFDPGIGPPQQSGPPPVPQNPYMPVMQQMRQANPGMQVPQMPNTGNAQPTPPTQTPWGTPWSAPGQQPSPMQVLQMSMRQRQNMANLPQVPPTIPQPPQIPQSPAQVPGAVGTGNMSAMDILRQSMAMRQMQNPTSTQVMAPALAMRQGLPYPQPAAQPPQPNTYRY